MDSIDLMTPMKVLVDEDTRYLHISNKNYNVSMVGYMRLYTIKI